jgi:hypothetical protein
MGESITTRGASTTPQDKVSPAGSGAKNAKQCATLAILPTAHVPAVGITPLKRRLTTATLAPRCMPLLLKEGKFVFGTANFAPMLKL